ncbi:hypothetical protein [Terrisporobacter petrolearius]|uniref:hypothetical protein n=1 Tax=Terrisporobacter petrolearius TaxID=1460447 RepID=UPI003EC08EF6
MQRKSRKLCSYPNCPELTDRRYCDKYQTEINKIYNKSCRPYGYLYKTSIWRKLMKQFLLEHPLCKVCKKQGCI